MNSSEENQRKKTANLFILYIEGVSIVTSKGSGGRLGQNNVEFSLKDYYAIQVLF